MTGTVTETEQVSKPEGTNVAPIFTPRFDILENKDELVLQGDMPGAKQDELDIRYENEQLTIRGRVASRDEGKEFIRREYEVGDFQRSFSIGEAIDASKITAELNNGVLTIHLPKTEEKKNRRIAVKAV